MKRKPQKLKKTTRPARWVHQWSRRAGVRAEFVGMTDDGRARVRIDGENVAMITASDVAEVIGEDARGASFDDSGALVLWVEVIGWAF